MPPDATDGTDAIASIEAANIANILAKLKAGKVLTRDEEKRLLEYQERENLAAAGDRRGVDLEGKVADSMEQAAALSGFPKDILQRAKQAGCSAFRGSRVHLDELAEWMADNADTLPTGNSELDAINLEIAREKLRKTKWANDVEQGRYISRDDEAAKVEAMALELKATLRKRCEEELPERLVGRSREEILALMRTLVDELCRDFSKGAEQLGR